MMNTCILRARHVLATSIVSAGLLGSVLPAQTPLQSSGYKTPTSHADLVEFVQGVAGGAGHVSVEVIGQSVQGREIPAVTISKGEYGADPAKVTALIFAQLHGNEQSGKEGALLLIQAFARGDYNHLLEDIDLIVIPQVNPDGSEINRRLNAQGTDLNRDMLVLDAPENRVLHDFFKRHLPEVSVDVHEYAPYGNAWREFGYLKDFDIQVGLLTNPNIHGPLLAYQNERLLPALQQRVEANGYSFFNYIIGGVPELEPTRTGNLRMERGVPVANVTRHSNVGLYDGRQSFGILNTFAMIYEGKNGRDRFVENLEERAHCQFTTMVALLEFVQDNKGEIKTMVREGRDALNQAREGEKVVIAMDLAKGDGPLKMPLRSVATGEIEVMEVAEYYPVVVPTAEVERPAGYLVPRKETALVEWMRRHQIRYLSEYTLAGQVAYQYVREAAGEGLRKERLAGAPAVADYYLVPIGQLHSNVLVLSLEPHSQLGLTSYDPFKHLLQSPAYPVLRVESR